MYRAFRPSEQVDPWDLIFHRIAILDAAGAIAEKNGDIDYLVQISQEVASASDDLIQVYLLLTQEGEEEDVNVKPSNPIGFHAPEPTDEG